MCSNCSSSKVGVLREGLDISGTGVGYIRRRMKLLVTGGAGYIGSIVGQRLLQGGHDVAVLDDLSRGNRAAVASGGYDGVLHFAALALVGESVSHPERYWRTNVTGTLNLLDAMRAAGIGRLVFSSTCACYGEPDRVPVDEDVRERPTSPYGDSKLAVDRMISTECAAHGLGAVSLRYFNVAGASGPLGADHEPETHLIPNVLKVALGQREHV